MSKNFTVGPLHETAWSRAFAFFLSIYAAYVVAERDLLDIGNSQDLALSLWERDRDRARMRLIGMIARLESLPVSIPEDRPAQRFVCLIGRMLDENDLDFPRQLHRELKASCFARYQVAGFGPIAEFRNGQLIQARQLVDAMIALPFYDYLPSAEIAPNDPPEADDLPPCAF